MGVPLFRVNRPGGIGTGLRAAASLMPASGAVTSRPSPRSPNSSAFRLLSVFAGTLLLLTVGATTTLRTASAATGDIGFQGPSHSGTGTPTGTKRSESVEWYNDGAWWANMWDTASSDFHIFKLNGSTKKLVDTGVVTQTRSNTHSDVLWSGGKLYISSHQFVSDGQLAVSGSPSYLFRYTYAGGKYTLESKSQINNYKTETLTIDKETNSSVLWATWQQGNRIYVTHTTGTANTTWATPFPLPGAPAVTVDDTSALIAFSGKIGVMWGSQGGTAADGYYFSTHTNGAADSAWSTPVNASRGTKLGDDHMNLKWLDTSGGVVYAAVKTSLTSAGDPLIQLLRFNGTWSTHTIAKVSECPNRVIVLIDETAQRLRTFATYPKPAGTTNGGVCTASGGAIYEKSSPMSNISFPSGLGNPVMMDADSYLHNVSSTKQNITSATGLALLADNNATRTYWYSYEPPTGTPVDTTPPDTTITSGPSGTVSATSASFSFSATETSTYTCSLDGAAFTACSSPKAYSGLAAGAHTLPLDTRRLANGVYFLRFEAGTDTRSARLVVSH